MEHVQSLRMSFRLAGPVNARIFHTVFRKELAGTSRGKKVIPLLLKHACRRKHIYLLLRSTGRKQDVLLGDTVTDRKHGLQDGTGGITADTAHLTRTCHIHTQHRICLLQAVEGKLACLDAYIVQVEEVLVRLLYRNAEHYLRGQFDKVDFKHLADKRERTAGTQVTFNHFDIIVLGQILDIKRTGNVQFPRNLTTDALDTAYRLYVQFLRRELDGGVTGVYTGKFDVLADGVCHDFAVLRHSIHLHFLGMLNELAYHNRMFLADVRRQLQEAFQFLPVGADIHRRARKNV